MCKLHMFNGCATVPLYPRYLVVCPSARLFVCPLVCNVITPALWAHWTVPAQVLQCYTGFAALGMWTRWVLKPWRAQSASAAASEAELRSSHTRVVEYSEEIESMRGKPLEVADLRCQARCCRRAPPPSLLYTCTLDNVCVPNTNKIPLPHVLTNSRPNLPTLTLPSRECVVAAVVADGRGTGVVLYPLPPRRRPTVW